MLFTLPASLSSKIVFIQYLAALAICEAVDDDGRLGVKIKWPNDIYAEVEGVGGSEVGSGKKGKAKIGGILVNTNYVGGQWRIVIGERGGGGFRLTSRLRREHSERPTNNVRLPAALASFCANTNANKAPPTSAFDGIDIRQDHDIV